MTLTATINAYEKDTVLSAIDKALVTLSAEQETCVGKWYLSNCNQTTGALWWKRGKNKDEIKADFREWQNWSLSDEACTIQVNERRSNRLYVLRQLIETPHIDTITLGENDIALLKLYL